jgi:bacterial/archaeal transporter family-2 protein
MSIEGLRYLVLGVFAGMCVCMEMSLNSLLGRHVGVLRSTLAPFITGLVALLIILFFVTGERLGSLNQWMKAPWYSLFGGLFAALFVAINIFIIPKVGIAAGLSAVIVGQLLLSTFFDSMGWFGLERIPISLPRIIGMVLLIIGVRLMFLRST